MKKIISLLLALVMCLSLCACDSNNNTNNEGNTNNESNTSNTSSVPETTTTSEEDNSLTYYDENGTMHINVERFPEYVEFIDLTTENWKEYIEVYSYSYDEKKVEKDAFGDIISDEVVTHTGRLLGAGNERYHSFVKANIELKDKATGELTVYSLGREGVEVGEDFNLDNYECTRINGKLCFLKIAVGELPVSTYIDFLYIYPGTHSFDGVTSVNGVEFY